MASSFTVTKIVDGSRNTTIKIDITGDTSSELTLAKVFDVTQFVNQGVNKRLRKIQYCLNGFSGQLYWEAAANTPLITLEKDHYSEADYREIGYLLNTGIAGKTGCILLSTNGLTAALSGYIILFIQSRDTMPGKMA